MATAAVTFLYAFERVAALQGVQRTDLAADWLQLCIECRATIMLSAVM